MQVYDKVYLMAYEGSIAIIWQFLSEIFPCLQLWFHHVHKPYSLKNRVLKNNLLGECDYYLNVKNPCQNMAINIWRCHIVADTPTSPLNEPAYYSDNSENPLKYEHLVTEYAILTTSILISVSCPKIVQWDAINYNQAPGKPQTSPHWGRALLCILCSLWCYLIDVQESYLFILAFIYISL